MCCHGQKISTQIKLKKLADKLQELANRIEDVLQPESEPSDNSTNTPPEDDLDGKFDNI